MHILRQERRFLFLFEVLFDKMVISSVGHDFFQFIFVDDIPCSKTIILSYYSTPPYFRFKNGD